jgi:hypothetical protein
MTVLSPFSLQCMDKGIALTQARYLDKEEKCLPPPRLVNIKRAVPLPALHSLNVLGKLEILQDKNVPTVQHTSWSI